MRKPRFQTVGGRIIEIDGRGCIYIGLCRDKSFRYAIAPAHCDELARMIGRMLNRSPKARALAAEIRKDRARQESRQ